MVSNVRVSLLLEFLGYFSSLGLLGSSLSLPLSQYRLFSHQASSFALHKVLDVRIFFFKSATETDLEKLFQLFVSNVDST